MTTHEHFKIASGIVERFLEDINQRVPKQPRQVAIDTQAVNKIVSYFLGQAERHSNALVEGDISVNQWIQRMEAELYTMHFSLYVAGQGGVRDMTRDDLTNINAIVQDQALYLRRWAAQLRQEQDAWRNLSNAEREQEKQKLLNRANLYAGAGNATTQQSNATARGLPMLPFYPGDGTTDCLTNCHCRWRYRKLEGDGNYNCFWVLGNAEHCDQCVARARACNPLRVREGVIVDAQRLQVADLFR